MATLTEIMDALASQIETELAGVSNLQVHGRIVWNPTPPAIDVYPATPFQDGLAFGIGNKEVYFVVRARVNTPDHEGAQELLLDLMDPDGANSMERAIRSDKTLGGVIERLMVTDDSPTEFGVFIDPGGGALLGCTWRVVVIA